MVVRVWRARPPKKTGVICLEADFFHDFADAGKCFLSMRKREEKKNPIHLIWRFFTLIILHCCILNKVCGCVLSKNVPATESRGKIGWKHSTHKIIRAFCGVELLESLSFKILRKPITKRAVLKVSTYYFYLLFKSFLKIFSRNRGKKESLK